MGRKRRTVVRKVVKPYPTIFLCPICNRETVTVDVNRKKKAATITCGSCNISKEVEYMPIHMPVDAYCKFYDAVLKERAGED